MPKTDAFYAPAPGGGTFSTSFATILYDAPTLEDIATFDFDEATEELTIKKDGLAVLLAHTTAYIASPAPVAPQQKIEVDTGGGYGQLIGSQVFNHCDLTQTSTEYGTCVSWGVHQGVTNDKARIRFRGNVAGGSLTTTYEGYFLGFKPCGPVFSASVQSSQNLTTSYQDILFVQDVIDSKYYSYDPTTGILTVKKSSNYAIWVRLCTTTSTGSNNEVTSRYQIDTGSGFGASIEVGGHTTGYEDGYGYHIFPIGRTLPAGSRVKFEAIAASTDANHDTVANGCSFFAMEVPYDFYYGYDGAGFTPTGTLTTVPLDEDEVMKGAFIRNGGRVDYSETGNWLVVYSGMVTSNGAASGEMICQQGLNGSAGQERAAVMAAASGTEGGSVRVTNFLTRNVSSLGDDVSVMLDAAKGTFSSQAGSSLMMILLDDRSYSPGDTLRRILVDADTEIAETSTYETAQTRTFTTPAHSMLPTDKTKWSITSFGVGQSNVDAGVGTYRLYCPLTLPNGVTTVDVGMRSRIATGAGASSSITVKLSRITLSTASRTDPGSIATNSSQNSTVETDFAAAVSVIDNDLYLYFIEVVAVGEAGTSASQLEVFSAYVTYTAAGPIEDIQ